MIRRTTTRETVASVQPRHGAYRIGFMGPATDEATPGELYEAASSLKAAKRVAVDGARHFGYSGAVRWKSDEQEPTLLWLEMTYADEYEVYEGAEITAVTYDEPLSGLSGA